MFKWSDQVMDFTLVNLAPDSNLNFNLIHKPGYHQDTKDPGREAGINEINELHPLQAYTVEADQRTGKELVLAGLTQKDAVTGAEKKVTVTDSETLPDKPKGFYIYLSVIPELKSKQEALFREGTVWKACSTMVRLAPPRPVYKSRGFVNEARPLSLGSNSLNWRNESYRDGGGTRGAGCDFGFGSSGGGFSSGSRGGGAGCDFGFGSSGGGFSSGSRGGGAGFGGGGFAAPAFSAAPAYRSLNLSGDGDTVPESSPAGFSFGAAVASVPIAEGLPPDHPEEAEDEMDYNMFEDGADSAPSAAPSAGFAGAAGFSFGPPAPAAFSAIDVGSTQAGRLSYGQSVQVRGSTTNTEYAYDACAKPAVLCLSIAPDLTLMPLSDLDATALQELSEFQKDEGKRLIASLVKVYQTADTCLIDLESPADTIICRCGHQCINHASAKALMGSGGYGGAACPMCRGPIDAMVRADGIIEA